MKDDVYHLSYFADQTQNGGCMYWMLVWGTNSVWLTTSACSIGPAYELSPVFEVLHSDCVLVREVQEAVRRALVR
jgi:hypothetical protein